MGDSSGRDGTRGGPTPSHRTAPGGSHPGRDGEAVQDRLRLGGALGPAIRKGPYPRHDLNAVRTRLQEDRRLFGLTARPIPAPAPELRRSELGGERGAVRSVTGLAQIWTNERRTNAAGPEPGGGSPSTTSTDSQRAPRAKSVAITCPVTRHSAGWRSE